jgi:hypothetical protein
LAVRYLQLAVVFLNVGCKLNAFGHCIFVFLDEIHVPLIVVALRQQGLIRAF